MFAGAKSSSDAKIGFLSFVQQYADKCLLDVFLDVCQQDYVEKIDNNMRKNVVQAM